MWLLNLLHNHHVKIFCFPLLLLVFLLSVSIPPESFTVSTKWKKKHGLVKFILFLLSLNEACFAIVKFTIVAGVHLYYCDVTVVSGWAKKDLTLQQRDLSLLGFFPWCFQTIIVTVWACRRKKQTVLVDERWRCVITLQTCYMSAICSDSLNNGPISKIVVPASNLDTKTWKKKYGLKNTEVTLLYVEKIMKLKMCHSAHLFITWCHQMTCECNSFWRQFVWSPHIFDFMCLSCHLLSTDVYCVTPCPFMSKCQRKRPCVRRSPTNCKGIWSCRAVPVRVILCQWLWLRWRTVNSKTHSYTEKLKINLAKSSHKSPSCLMRHLWWWLWMQSPALCL